MVDVFEYSRSHHTGTLRNAGHAVHARGADILPLPIDQLGRPVRLRGLGRHQKCVRLSLAHPVFHNKCDVH